MKKFLLFFAFTTFSLQAQIVFPDANFKAKLLEASPSNQIAKNLQNLWFKIDANDDGEIQESEAQNVKELDISNSNISNLIGISFFNNLSSIKASYNNLTAFNFFGLSSITTIVLDNNQITSEGLTYLIGYKNLLDLRNNSITSFDLNNYNQSQLIVHELDLSNNPLTNFNFNINFPNWIENLTLNNTLLTSITGIVKGVAVGQSTSKVVCNQNQFLISVNIISNDEFGLNMKLNPNLTSLTIDNLNYGLSLTIEDNEQLSNVNLSNVFNVTNFNSFINNPIVDFTASNCLNYSLNISGSNIETLDLSGFKYLQNFTVENNSLLETIIVKNGFHDVFPFLTFTNNPILTYICADEWDIESYTSSPVVQSNNINVNSYCSFNPGGTYYTINGQSKYDVNEDGCDEIDATFPNLKFNITNGSLTGSIISNTSGNYSIPVQSGTHTITPIFENPTYFNVSPANFAVTFPAQTSPFTQNFCITPNGTHQDVEVVIVPLNVAIPGFDTSYKLVYKNKGNTTVSGSISFTFMDNVMDFVSSNPIQSMVEPNILNWNYTNLQPFETREIIVTFNLNSPQETPALNGGEILEFIAIIDPLSGDEMPSDNTSTLNQEVVNSFDPNDKTCLEGSVVSTELIGQYVHYVIRFENTGTFFAQNVVVKDEIDLSKFDLNSLIVSSASHQQWTRINGNKVEFIFENIQLPFPPSEERHGYIAFKIKLKNNLTVGDTFSNFASIYFDYNFPIITEPATTAIEALSNPDFEFSSFVKLYPNPASSVVTIESQTINLKSVEIFNSLGQLLQAIPNENNQLNIDVSSLQTGTYFVKVHSDKGVGVSKFVKQ